MAHSPHMQLGSAAEIMKGCHDATTEPPSYIKLNYTCIRGPPGGVHVLQALTASHVRSGTTCGHRCAE